MTIVLILYLIIVPFLLGTLACNIIKEKGRNQIETYLTGVLFLFLLFQGLMVLTIKAEFTFHRLVTVFSLITAVLCITSLAVCRRELIKSLKIRPVKLYSFTIIAIVLFVAQALFLWLELPELGNSITVETVQTTIATDSVYRFHPSTGTPFSPGMTFLGKLVSLPIFYSYLCDMFELDILQGVCQIIPIWLLLLSYMGYGLLASRILEGGTDKGKKVAMFLAGYGVFNLFGNYSSLMTPYQIFHSGFEGNTITMTVLLPMLMCELLQMVNQLEAGEKRFFKSGMWRSGLGILLLIAATVCITGVDSAFYRILISIILFVGIYEIGKIKRVMLCRKS